MERVSAFFEMLQPGVEDFFHTVKFSPPKIAHIVEALIDAVESIFHRFELCRHEGQKQAGQRRIKNQRHPDREIKLLIGHQRISARS